jgi:NADH-quinone oxidoreductase subunit K|tara:strand:- start:121 stop:483 length:363 start_codon:yes stop_codon:yes gene_type:complete
VVAGSNPATLSYPTKNVVSFMNCLSFLTCSTLLFLLGIWGIFFNRKNIVVMLMCIELMLLAVNLNFLIFSAYLDDLIGQLFSLLVLTVAAAESAIGLALLVIYHKTRGNIQIEYMNQLKG